MGTTPLSVLLQVEQLTSKEQRLEARVRELEEEKAALEKELAKERKGREKAGARAKKLQEQVASALVVDQRTAHCVVVNFDLQDSR